MLRPGARAGQGARRPKEGRPGSRGSVAQARERWPVARTVSVALRSRAVNSDLHAFVHECLARGVARDEIRRVLAAAGWPAEEVEAALAAWADVPFVIPVPRRRPYLSARETFEYLVMFVTLYITAFNVGLLLFEAVERWVPDTVRRGFVADQYSSDRVRGGVAAVLIAFPIFLFLSRLIGNAVRREPEKRASRIRKWLTYLTLFVAAIVIIGDLTYLVTRLLSGELPPRFLLKTLIVFAIAATVFGHYLADLRREESESPELPARGPSLLARVAAVGIFATLGLGLVMAGSPRAERQRQLDLQRAEDLRTLAAGVQDYYHEYRALPDSLGMLAQLPGGGMSTVRDPVTRRPYEYRTLDSLRFELCATFDAADSNETRRPYERPGRRSDFWRHGAGRHCFPLRVSKTAAGVP